MIKAENITKYFGPLMVLKDFSLEISPGETLVILGRSGAGKSVFLKLLLGLEKPDSGHIIINDTIISSLFGPPLYRAIKHMGMLFQGGALFDSMSVFENVAFYLMQHGKLPLSEISDRVSLALKMVEMQGSERKMPAELSGGMRKRVALARLIVYRPTVILYDEPTTGLDPITAMHINELIIKTKEELKATSIVVTHDIASALTVADRLALLEDGKIATTENKEAFTTSKHPSIQAFLSYLIPKGVIS